MDRLWHSILTRILLFHFSKATLPTGCDDGTPKCPANSTCASDTFVCSDGFKINTAADGFVAKPKVTDTDCTKGSADRCTGIQHAECNSAATSATCKCSDGYAAVRKTGTSCVKTVSGTTCAAGEKEYDGIENSHYESTKCQCDDAFAMNVDICAAESSAISLHFGSLTLFFFDSTMVRHLFW